MCLFLKKDFIMIEFIVNKIIGILLILFGLFMVLKFPQTESWQLKGFTMLGILVGIISLGGGVYLLFS